MFVSRKCDGNRAGHKEHIERFLKDSQIENWVNKRKMIIMSYMTFYSCLFISSKNRQKSSLEICYRSKPDTHTHTHTRIWKKNTQFWPKNVNRLEKEPNKNKNVHCQRIATVLYSTHSWIQNQMMIFLLLTCIAFLGRQQLVVDDDVFIYVSFSEFLDFGYSFSSLFLILPFFIFHHNILF